jgi:hypothetical protein
MKGVKSRNGGRCEAGTDARTGRGEHVHHIQMRSHGGSDDEANLLHVCQACHGAIHANPSLSYERGWLRHPW